MKQTPINTLAYINKNCKFTDQNKGIIMKKLLILFLSVCSFSFAQTEPTEVKKSKKELKKERKEARKEKDNVYALDFPQGIYFSFESLMAKTPEKTSRLVVAKRNSGAIKRRGGNDYKLYDSNFRYKNREINKDFYAYSNGTELYINGLKYKLQHSYFKVVSNGKYLVFKSGIPTNATKKSIQMQIANAKAPVGKKLSGPILATFRFVYILDKETQKLTVVDKRSLPLLLADAPQLLERYAQEDQPDSNKTLLKYMVEYNQMDEEDKTPVQEDEL